LGGPDASFSLNPVEFKLMVDSVRDAEKALGKATFELSEKDKKNRVFARSLFIVKDLKTGDILTENNVRSIRPNNGLAPKYIKDVIGKRVIRSVKSGTPLSWSLIDE
ncbi:SAF domain-containing protein, partial [Clostridium sp.]|uniref:SAF domain-containing protein n=1 Tax=Clostridium sp. TaxID=1506 RepID=UPI00284A4B72